MTGGRRGPYEIVVFIAPDNDGPLSLARQLRETVSAGRAEIGIDALTGGVEVRFYYEPQVLAAARQWLRDNQIVHDINLL